MCVLQADCPLEDGTTCGDADDAEGEYTTSFGCITVFSAAPLCSVEHGSTLLLTIPAVTPWWRIRDFLVSNWYIVVANFSGLSWRKIQQDATMYQNFIPYLYEAQHVSGDTPPIIRSLKIHWQPLVFHTWKVVGRMVGGRCQAHTVPDNVHQPHVQQPSTVLRKTRGCQCSFRLLMMGGVLPETCWASYK